MNYAITSTKTQAQLHKFLGIFSPHFSKPKQRFLGQMLYGIQAAQDVKLSCIGRALEEDISMKKLEDRLSRNLADEDIEPRVRECIVRESARHVSKESFIVVDPTDIRKFYAEKMEYLDRVRDGSRDELCKGYWGCLAVAAEAGSRRITPLDMSLWSCHSPEFRSENEQILELVKAVAGSAKGRGTFVIDRGGDRPALFHHFIDNKLGFVIRLVGNRNLLLKDKRLKSKYKKILAETLANSCRMLHTEVVERESSKGLNRCELSFGAVDVRLPKRPDAPLRMVVVKGFGKEPMMLLTTLAPTTSRESLWRVVEGYLSRWRVEDTLRYIKQCYHLEDLRVLTYQRMKNMIALLLASVYFASTWLGSRQRMEVLTSHITHAAKRIYGVVEFFYYALADGIARIFSKGTRWKDAPGKSQNDSNADGSTQMCFDFDG